MKHTGWGPNEIWDFMRRQRKETARRASVSTWLMLTFADAEYGYWGERLGANLTGNHRSRRRVVKVPTRAGEPARGVEAIAATRNQNASCPLIVNANRS